MDVCIGLFCDFHVLVHGFLALKMKERIRLSLGFRLRRLDSCGQVVQRTCIESKNGPNFAPKCNQ